MENVHVNYNYNYIHIIGDRSTSNVKLGLGFFSGCRRYTGHGGWQEGRSGFRVTEDQNVVTQKCDRQRYQPTRMRKVLCFYPWKYKTCPLWKMTEAWKWRGFPSRCWRGNYFQAGLHVILQLQDLWTSLHHHPTLNNYQQTVNGNPVKLILSGKPWTNCSKLGNVKHPTLEMPQTVDGTLWTQDRKDKIKDAKAPPDHRGEGIQFKVQYRAEIYMANLTLEKSFARHKSFL